MSQLRLWRRSSVHAEDSQDEGIGEAAVRREGWPRWPYRGLDFYRESDRLLFRGRESDVRACANLLIGLSVNVLLLQGSSGSGKSSFLRAGLLPFLNLPRGNRGRPGLFFLRIKENVIRCTADPVAEIARAVLSALQNQKPCIGSDEESEDPLPEDVRAVLRAKVERLLAGPVEPECEELVDVLEKIAGTLPGPLVIVLDQAEEVLTRSDGTTQATAAAARFFRFLEDIYLRNLDVRLIVSLRTEYYGRFRDELRVGDRNFVQKANAGSGELGGGDRNSTRRARAGGVDPYLLRPLRAPAALTEIILAPTRATLSSGKPVYDFSLEKGLAERIVADLLKRFPHASVTPPMQVVCSSLYSHMPRDNRIIAHKEYDALGGAEGIIQAYLREGIAAVKPASEREREQWYFLLLSLVSRQGGGTVVSLAESLGVLEARAREQGIEGDIAQDLFALTSGAAPLLRGEPPANPQYFSLKHDVLAVILSGWNDEHGGAIRARRQERTRARWFLATGAVVAAIMIFSVAVVAYNRGKDTFKARHALVEMKNLYAENSSGNFRAKLLGLLETLNVTSRPDLYESMMERGRIQDETLGTLRKIVPRVPRLADQVVATGLDPQSDKLALLRQIEGSRDLRLDIVRLSGPATGVLQPEGSGLIIPSAELEGASEGAFIRAAGFISDLGPAVYVGGRLFFWNERNEVQSRDVLPDILKAIPDFGDPSPRADFVAGYLQITHMKWGGTVPVRVVRLAAKDLMPKPARVPVPPHKLAERFILQALPLVSNAMNAPAFHGVLEIGSQPDASTDPHPSEPAPSGAKAPVLYPLNALVGQMGTDKPPVRIQLARVVRPPLNSPERRHHTFAFADNTSAVVFKMDGPRFYVMDKPELAVTDQPMLLREFAIKSETASDDNAAWLVRPATMPLLHPLMTGARQNGRWRAAWLAANGVWAVESDNDAEGEAVANPALPLMSGQAGGVKLQYSRDGNFLMLVQQQQWNGLVNVRIWDLRDDWRSWAKTATRAELVAFACSIARDEGQGDESQQGNAQLFQNPPDPRKPCPLPESSMPRQVAAKPGVQ